MKKFKKFYLEITSACNLACSFCPPTLRPKQFISPEDFAKRLDQIKPYTDYINLHVKGEPLLHPKLGQLLDISAEKGFYVNITTNGTLITKKKQQLLNKQALRQINFSLHSYQGQAEPLNNEGYLKNVFAFIKEATCLSNLIVSLRLWNLSQANMTDVEVSKNRDILEMIESEFGLTYKIEEKSKPGSGIKIADRIYINQDYAFQWPSLAEVEGDGKGFCYGLRNQAGILADGTVVPCCLDGEGVINLGNINEQSFSEIVASERAVALVDGFSRRVAVEELCRKCGYRKRFDN
ncbi:radical SAM/SPASM domain-containing protein [Amphibacillus cookii]|uniref:radical SAM/SPASM domain-containing protein n=1 Tax=Amphibacillus cookii TaxID=767787 RepID=UPI001959D51F|nr:radical SAM/SPASM domain-containing protein [Amphibacillus cookii]MBM7540297.1 radical SAM protein with 4Fe4S-binding SPASM domain [Amphibacillus cookii]